MRKFTLKRQKLNRVANKWRAAFRESIGQCDACGTTERLSLHELGQARGKNRMASLMEPSCILCLCLADTAACLEGCHEIWDKRTELDQLALLYEKRPDAFNLRRYLQITSPNSPERITSTELLQAVLTLRAAADGLGPSP